MAGPPIVAVNEGLELLYKLLMNDPVAKESVWISLIRFASRASQDPLMPIDVWLPPILSAQGSRSTGAALLLLAESIEEDLRHSTPQQPGDYRPLVLLLTDGTPTDNYLAPATRIKALQGNRKPTIVALGCGPNVDVDMLRMLTSEVFLMANVTTVQIRSYFKLND